MKFVVGKEFLFCRVSSIFQNVIADDILRLFRDGVRTLAFSVVSIFNRKDFNAVLLFKSDEIAVLIGTLDEQDIVDLAHDHAVLLYDGHLDIKSLLAIADLAKASWNNSFFLQNFTLMVNLK